jgi:uncharacterized protein YggE
MRQPPPNAAAPRILQLAVALAALVAGGCMERPHYAGSFDVPAEAGGRSLTVTGTGRVLLPPTHVDFDCVLTTDHDTPAQTWVAAGNRMTRLVTALQDEGVPQTDFAPRSARLSTRSKGWRVTQHLHVGVDDLTRVAPLLEVVMGPGGANDVTNLRPGHKNPRGAADRARERALVNARDTAEMLAAELSLRLGDVLSVEEMSSTAERGPGAAAEREEASAGEDLLDVSAELRVTYRLAP